MFDSLVLANQIELLYGGVASANPLCPGAMFRLQPGANPGAPQPTITPCARALARSSLMGTWFTMCPSCGRTVVCEIARCAMLAM